MDIPGAILHAEDVAGLGEMGRDQKVTRDLAMMGVITPECPLHRQPGGDDRAVDIDREPGQVQGPQGLTEELGLEVPQRILHGNGALAKPARERAIGGQYREAAEARDEWIAL